MTRYYFRCLESEVDTNVGYGWSDSGTRVEVPSVSEPVALLEHHGDTPPPTTRTAGEKHDQGKPMWSTIPQGAVRLLAEVGTYGALKYKENPESPNWQRVESPRRRYYDAANRHIDEWWHGERNDRESGIHHLAHAAWNLLVLAWFDAQ